MQYRTRSVVISLICSMLAVGGGSTRAGAAVELGQPVAVSPGTASRLTWVEDRCPTFSWGAVPDAEGYELVIYSLATDRESAPAEWLEKVAGSASSWTPSVERCLDRAGQYAWSIRATGENAASEWSIPNLFAVAPAVSSEEFEEALLVVRRYLAVETPSSAAPQSRSGERTAAFPSSALLAAAPAPLAPATGDSDMQVNGSPVVTVATLAGALCATTEVRFLDLGDGTVLDCNTGRQWLKDASCLGLWPYEDGSDPNIFDKISDLNGGTDFGCAGYAPGTYTDWELPEISDLCSAPTVLEVCPGGSAADSIVDSSTGPPAVPNAAGDGVWTEEDAFVGVQSDYYWSATNISGGFAWAVSFDDALVIDENKTYLRNILPVRGGG